MPDVKNCNRPTWPALEDTDDNADLVRAELPLPFPRRGLRRLAGAVRDGQRPAERAFCLVEFRRATTAAQRRRILTSPSLAVVVRVPSAAWVRPVIDMLQCHAHWDHVISGAKLLRSVGAEPDDVTAAVLAGGGRVLGVSPDPRRFLPTSILAAADVTATLAAPGADDIATVIAVVLNGRRPRHVPPAVGSGLDLVDLVAAVRPGTTPAECIGRLVAASTSRSIVDPEVADAPPLSALHGYGEAMAWCNDTLADIATWRAGETPFPQAARVVLAGPPGVGKTSLARSFAKAAALPLVVSSVASWFSTTAGHLDSIIKAIDQLWERARANGPAVLLLDEIDALPDRSAMGRNGRDWWTPVVNHILAALDSATSSVTRDLIIIGATNHADHLDEALLRPGRLERVIQIQPPEDVEARVGILRSHLGDDLQHVDLAAAGLATPGATGARLMAIVRDARRRARIEGRPLRLQDLLAMAAPPDARSADARRRSAVHEVGHAVVGSALGFEVQLISCIATPETGGMVSFRFFETEYRTMAAGQAYACMLMAGLAAEEIVLGERSTSSGGATFSDLARATNLLTSLRKSHGMGRTLAYAPMLDDAPPWATDPRIVADVEADLQACLRRAKSILAGRRASVEALIGSLLDARVLDGATVAAILAANPPEAAEPNLTPPSGVRLPAPDG